MCSCSDTEFVANDQTIFVTLSLSGLIYIVNIYVMQKGCKKKEKYQLEDLTLYTQTSGCIFSKLFSIHFLGFRQGEFVQQSRSSIVGDHSFILLT